MRACRAGPTTPTALTSGAALSQGPAANHCAPPSLLVGVRLCCALLPLTILIAIWLQHTPTTYQQHTHTHTRTHTLTTTGGAVSIWGWSTAFRGKSSLQMTVKKNDVGTPDFSVTLSGPDVGAV